MGTRKGAFVLLILVLLASFGTVPARLVACAGSADDWPMFHHDLTRNGYTESAAAITDPVELLRIEGGGGNKLTSPAIADGVFYVCAGDLRALNASTGETLWEARGSVDSSPFVTGGVVYISGHGPYNAATGAEMWDDATGNPRHIYAVADGCVYTDGDVEPGLVARNAVTGAEIWHSTAQCMGYCISAAVAYGCVYFGKLTLNATTGAKIWDFPEGTAIFDFSSPAVADGKVYVGSSSQHSVYCINAYTGAKIWNYTTGSTVFSSPAVADGVVYVGSGDCNLYALDARTGQKIWNYTTGGGVNSSPAVAGGVVYVGSDDGNLYAFDASTGNKLWNYTMQEKGEYLRYSPAVADGKVYMSSGEHLMVVLGDKSTTPAPTASPSPSPSPTPSPTAELPSQIVSITLAAVIILVIASFVLIHQKRLKKKRQQD